MKNEDKEIIRTETGDNVFQLYADRIVITRKKKKLLETNVSDFFRRRNYDIILLSDIKDAYKLLGDINLVLVGGREFTLSLIALNIEVSDEWLGYLNKKVELPPQKQTIDTNIAENGKKFCDSCGALIDAKATYCKVCGVSVEDEETENKRTTVRTTRINNPITKGKVAASIFIAAILVFGGIKIYDIYEVQKEEEIVAQQRAEQQEILDKINNVLYSVQAYPGYRYSVGNVIDAASTRQPSVDIEKLDKAAGAYRVTISGEFQYNPWMQMVKNETIILDLNIDYKSCEIYLDNDGVIQYWALYLVNSNL